LEEHSERDQLLVAALKSRIPPASASTIALKLGISQQTLESWLDTFGVSYLKRLRQPLPDWEQRFGLAEYELFIAEMQTMRQTQQGGSFFYTWAVLVCLGMEPQEAQLLLQQWQDYSQTLPSGQWIPEEWQARHQLGDSSMVRLMHGLTVPKAMAQKLLNTVRAGQKIKAIKDLRVAVYCGLKEAKEAVEDLADRGMTVMSGSFQPRRRKHRSEARKYLDCCISRLLTDFPLHWVILSAASIVEDPTHPTMAVGSSQNGQLFLFYNPDFTLKLLEEQAQGVLLHEVNHVLFQHLSPITGIDGSSMAWKFACECTANEYIPYSLPGNPITLELLGLPPKESTSTRYSKLLRRGLQGSLCAGIIERALKSGATHHQDTEDSPPRHPIAMIREAASLVGEEVPLETRLSLATHYPCDSWVERLEPEGLGSLPWKELLALSARGLRVRYATRRYPSRRQPESLGIVPGKRSRREHPRVLVAIDTSGSMGDYELLQIAEELRGLTEGDVAVTVVHCDSMIHEVTKVGKGFVLRELKGRGGTDLRPPFEEAFLRQHQPDLVVYFTDGYGPAPDAPPSNVEVLWILTGYRPQVPARFGKVVTMLPRDRRSRVKPLPT
jgi:predicted metal-dependent peptidase